MQPMVDAAKFIMVQLDEFLTQSQSPRRRVFAECGVVERNASGGLVKVIEEADWVPEDWMSAFEHQGRQQTLTDVLRTLTRLEQWWPLSGLGDSVKPDRFRRISSAVPGVARLGSRTDDAHQRREFPRAMRSTHRGRRSSPVSIRSEPGAGAGHREA